MISEKNINTTNAINNLENKPIFIECDITLRCNLKCFRCNRFCDISKNLDSDMSVNEIQNILYSIQSYEIGRFRIMGGEPTVNNNIIDICKEVLSYNNIKYVEILTNFINSDVLSKILKLYPLINIINFDGNTSTNIKYKKFIKHVNIYISPVYEHMLIPNIPCNIYNDYNNEKKLWNTYF